jgi:hypothetical protein
MPAEPAVSRRIHGKLQAHGPDAAISELADRGNVKLRLCLERLGETAAQNLRNTSVRDNVLTHGAHRGKAS